MDSNRDWVLKRYLAWPEGARKSEVDWASRRGRFDEEVD